MPDTMTIVKILRTTGKGEGMVIFEIEITSSYPNGKPRKDRRFRGDDFVPDSRIGRKFRYHFSNGTIATVSVNKIDTRKTKPEIKKCMWGYDWTWMIDSIISKGRIRRPEEW